MRANLFLLQTAFAVAACAASAAAQAQITKCVDDAGRISYTNSVCVDASAVAYIEVDAPASGAQTITVEPEHVVRAAPMHESAWARLPATPARPSTDSATVMQARQALAAIDRAVASMRTTKVAANN